MHRADGAAGFHPRSVLVVINQYMGDFILSTPALRQIRNRFPRAHLCVAGKSGVLEILASEDYVDELLPLDFRERVATWRSLPELWRVTERMRRRRFDLLVNLTTILDPSTFDVVCCLEGIEHLTPQAARGFLEEAHRVLRPLGLLLISTPYSRGKPHTGNPFHLHEYRPEELRKAVSGGFKVEQMIERPVDDVHVLYVRATRR